jgi:hypothetical protein
VASEVRPGAEAVGLTSLLRSIAAFVFDPGGGWGYPIVQQPTIEAGFVALCLVLGAIALAKLSESEIPKRESTVLVIWLSAGLAVTMWWRSLVSFSLERVIQSDGANGYYSVASQYSVQDFLSRFSQDFDRLPVHVRSNLPGKILLYELFFTVTDSPTVMAWLIALISTVGGGLLIYLFAKQLFRDRLVALYALVFYLVQPSRAYFFPLLNTVSPMLALLVAVLVMQFLKTKYLLWAAAVGVATYGLALFDPMVLVIGLPLLLLVARDVRTERISGRQAIQLAGYASGSFLAVHAIVVMTTNLSVFEAFLVAYRDSREFNTAQQRPYGFWVFHNAKDFLLHHGIVPALLCVSALWGALTRSRNAGAERATGPWLSDDVFPLLSFAAAFGVLNLSGVSRGETARLWIFLASFFQVIAARQCAVRWGSRVFGAACIVSILQAVILMQAVGWVIP